jgi:hypothetical protein
VLRQRISAALVVVTLLALPAAAADNGLYIGGSLGGSSLEVLDFDEDLGDIRFDDGDTAYKLFAGFRFLDFLAVEAGYLDLGTPSDTVGNGDVTVDIGVQGWDAFAVGMLPIGPIDIFAKLGVVSWEADIQAAIDDITDDNSESGTDLAYGLGLQLRLGSIGIRAEGERFDIAEAEEVYLFSVGASFTF